MSKPFYRIEYLCTYYDAIWMYKRGGLYNFPDSCNPWEYNDEDVFDNEEDARKVWNEQYTETYVWDPAEFGADEDNPEVGVSMYTLSRYDENGEEEVLEWSHTNITPEMVQEMYPDFDFENAEW